MSSDGGFKPFRRRTARDVATVHIGPNMTPMVDVVMVILVFFMVSAAFLGPEWLLQGLVPKQTALAGPQSTPSPGQGPKPPSGDPLATSAVRFTIDLTSTPAVGPVAATVTATGAGITGTIEQVMEALGQKVAGATSEVEVLIRPGPGVPWGPVVRVHELARKMGIERVGPQTGWKPAR